MSSKDINNIAWPDPQTGHIDVYAHRGSTLLAPENTSMAFDLALGYGADVLEIDVRLNRDSKVIVIHDARVDRTCNGQGAIKDMNMSQLKALDAGWHFSNLQGEPGRGMGARLSTLDELFEQYPSARINIDIKDNLEEAARAVALSIEAAGAQSRVNVGSFHAQALTHFRRISPEVTTAATRIEVAKLYFGRSLISSIPYKFLQIPVSYLSIPLATQHFLQQAKLKKLSVAYWTINDEATMQRLIGRGANGLVTDRVDIACKLLGKTATSN